MPGSVTVSGDPNPMPGKVRLVSSEIDRASRLGHVRIALGADAVARVGAFATAVVEVGRRDGVAVPASALSGQDGAWSVETVAEGDRVESHAVVRGLSGDDEVEIRNGLKAGDTVVARASAFLRPGDLVRPMPIALAREATSTGSIALAREVTSTDSIALAREATSTDPIALAREATSTGSIAPAREANTPNPIAPEKDASR
jgi:hypothetical protein